MSTRHTEDEQDFEISTHFRPLRPAAPPHTSGASDRWLGPSAAKVDNTGEDVVACTYTQPTLKLPQPIPFCARTPYHVSASPSQAPPSEHELPPQVERSPSGCSTSPTRYTSARPTAHTKVLADTTPTANTILHKHQRSSIQPTSLATTFASITSFGHTTPSACVFSTVHTAPLLSDTPLPTHACPSSPQESGGVVGDHERDPMVGLLYDHLPPHPRGQGAPSYEPPQPVTKGTPIPETLSSCIPKSVAFTPPVPPSPTLPSSTVSSPTASEDPYLKTNRDGKTCPEQTRQPTQTTASKMRGERGEGDAGTQESEATGITTTGSEGAGHFPTTLKFTNTHEVATAGTADSVTGSTRKPPVVPARGMSREAPRGVLHEDVTLLARKLRQAEEKIRDLEDQMEHQALQIAGLQGINESRTRENKQLRRRLRDQQCFHASSPSSAMAPTASNYPLGGNSYEIDPESAVNSGVRNFSYSELDPASNRYYDSGNTKGSSSGLSSYNDYTYGNDYEHSRLGHGPSGSPNYPGGYPMPNTIDALQERLSALHLQNHKLSSSLKEEKMKRSEMEDVIKRERGYIKRLEDSLEEMSKTRVVMDPSTYQQVAQAYIASRRPSARRKHGEASTYPGHLVCDLASNTQKESF